MYTILSGKIYMQWKKKKEEAMLEVAIYITIMCIV